MDDRRTDEESNNEIGHLMTFASDSLSKYHYVLLKAETLFDRWRYGSKCL
jgi:hypothetical protein